MVGHLRLDRPPLFRIYHQMLGIEKAWLDFRARDYTRGGEMTPEGKEVLRVEQARFADLILKIKRMLVAARRGTFRPFKCAENRSAIRPFYDRIEVLQCVQQLDIH